MARERRHKEEALLAAFAHPLRRRLLGLYLEADEPLSPKRLSEVVDKPLPNIGYHVRVLAQCGAVEIVAERPVRGSTEHFYAPTPLLEETQWVQALLGLPLND